jgi:predicted RNase H-like nuclease
MSRYLGIDLAWGEGSEKKPANRSGVVALDATGRIANAGWTIGLDEAVEWVEANALANSLLFIDAPLVITNATGARRPDRETGQRYGRWWVSANSVNLGSPRRAGVRLRERLEELGWRYSSGAAGPPGDGRVMSECYPYTTIVGVPDLGYDDKRPAYKRAKKGMPAAQAWPMRTAACDTLIDRIAGLTFFDPPLDLASHPETKRLVDEPSPARTRDYKQREDLLDAAICAWTAAYWHRHGLARSQILGVPDGTAMSDDLEALPSIVAPARARQRE